MNKIIDGMEEALVAAKCEHALVQSNRQPSDERYVRRYCSRCQASFYSPKSDLQELLRIGK